MALPTVEGTKLRNGRYYLNLRIPAEAAASFPGKTHLRDSLKTSDEKIAKRGVILAKAKLIEAAQDLRQQEMQTEAIAALPPDQRALFDEAGGTTRLHAQFAATDTSQAGPKVDTNQQPVKVLLQTRLAVELAVKGNQVDTMFGAEALLPLPHVFFLGSLHGYDLQSIKDPQSPGAGCRATFGMHCSNTKVTTQKKA